MAYLLDANVFIEGKRRYYGMDFCPAFWDWLSRENQNGKVYSIEKIGDELKAGGDELSEWASDMGSKFFLPEDAAMIKAFSTVSDWVYNQNYLPAAISAFLENPDFYLVSYALAHKHMVVTLELPSNAINRVKIPEVCIGVNVKFMTPFHMLRFEHASFILNDAAKVRK